MSFANNISSSPANSSLYVERRARLQRAGDGKPFHGWVEEVRGNTVRLRLGPSFEKLTPGDMVSVEVAGQEHTAAFMGEVVLAADWLIELEITEEVDLQPKKENPRLNMFGERCKIFVDDYEILGISVDISKTALGLVLTSALHPETMVEFEVSTQLGPIRGAGTILYCRADPFSGSRFRAAIEVTGLIPANQERWDKLQDFPSVPW